MSTFSCDCLKGFMGAQCEHNINDCDPNPCFNGGTCNDLVGDFSCSCPPGTEGSRCERNLDECYQGACFNGGICIDKIGTFECECHPGFALTRLELSSANVTQAILAPGARVISMNAWPILAPRKVLRTVSSCLIITSVTASLAGGGDIARKEKIFVLPGLVRTEGFALALNVDFSANAPMVSLDPSVAIMVTVAVLSALATTVEHVLRTGLATGASVFKELQEGIVRLTTETSVCMTLVERTGAVLTNQEIMIVIVNLSLRAKIATFMTSLLLVELISPRLLVTLGST